MTNPCYKKVYSVTVNTGNIKQRCQQFGQSTTQQFLHTMEILGFNKQQIIEAVTQYINEIV